MLLQIDKHKINLNKTIYDLQKPKSVKFHIN